MALREFTDSEGRRWRVWHTVPERTGGLARAFQAGWLTFDSEHERRRLAPVSADWETMPTERLALLLRLAEPVPRSDAPVELAQPERRRGERRRGDRRRSSRARSRPHSSARREARP